MRFRTKQIGALRDGPADADAVDAAVAAAGDGLGEGRDAGVTMSVRHVRVY